MRSDTVIDYAVFQLTPRRSRCELLVSIAGNTEKLASGLVKPFVSHLKVAAEQVALAVHSIKLEVQSQRNAETWFTKETLERFVRFVSTPEVLEMANKYDAEMSQLEAAQKIYSQGPEGQWSDGTDGSGAIAAADLTKKELLRAIDLRLAAVSQDLITACNRASAAGFNPDTVSELWQFADCFGANRLKEACTKFIRLGQRRPDLMSQWRLNLDDKAIRASWGSDMSIDEPCEEQTVKTKYHQTSKEQTDPSMSPPCRQNEKDEGEQKVNDSNESSIQVSRLTRRLSVQERINLFENKQKENSNSGVKTVAVGKPVELRGLSSDVSFPMSLEKAERRRSSGASDMSIDMATDKKDSACDSSLCTPTFSSVYDGRTSPKQFEDEGQNVLNDTADSLKMEQKHMPSRSSNPGFQDHEDVQNQRTSLFVKGKPVIKEQSDPTDKFGLQGVSLSDSLVGSGERNAKFGGTSDILGSARNSKSNHTREDIKLEFTKEDTESDRFASQSQGRSFTRATEAIQKKEQMYSGRQSVPEKDSQRMRSKKPVPAGSDQMQNSHDRPIEVDSVDGNSGQALASNNVSQYQEDIRKTDTTPVKQVQRARQPNGNQELNDELKMKANELEQLFAEQMLRVPGNQSGSARRAKPVDKKGKATASPAHRATEPQENLMIQSTLISNDIDNFETPPNSKMRKKLSGHDLSDDSRGKFYEKYMQKRDSRLREEWSSNRAEKEAKLKAMLEILDCNRAELKTRASASSGRLSRSHKRADKSAKMDQHLISSLRGEEDDDPYRSTQTKKQRPKKDASSLTPRSVGQPVSQLPARVSITSTTRRRSEKPVARSVPNFSDFRKENTKPSSRAGKTAARSQVRSSARNKSATEGVVLVKEEKPPRPTSLRKNSAVPVHSAKLSTLNPDDNVSVPAKLENDITQVKVSVENETLGDEDEWGESAVESEGSVELAKEEAEEEEQEEEEEEEEEELETMQVETCAKMDDEKPRTSQDSEKSANSEVITCGSMRSVSQIGPVSRSELPAATLKRQTIASLLDSPEESPAACLNETSDIDVSADSPVGSPAFWNFPDDAAQMRKKWGNAQKIVASNPSQNHTREVVTKKFKRLLNFGRKTRDTDLVDWISASTSEGDDDTEEDGKDPANLSFNESELLSQQVQTSNSSFPAPPGNFKLKDNQTSGTAVKAPRSFFSLSNFRSKGSDSKLR